jgi:hypothetical protein
VHVAVHLSGSAGRLASRQGPNVASADTPMYIHANVPAACLSDYLCLGPSWLSIRQGDAGALTRRCLCS